MFKQTFIKENFPAPHDNTLFCRYVVSAGEFEAISTYLDITSVIDRKLAEIRLKIARTKADYSPKFEDDPNLPSDQYVTFNLSINDADYFNVCCWWFIQRQIDKMGLT